MEILKIIVSGLIGTMLMTLFSYVCGQLFSKEFGEPYLLNKLLEQWPVGHQGNKPKNEFLLGWVIHLFIGFLFALFLYTYFAWKDSFGWRESMSNLFVAGYLGLVLGLLGVVGWVVLLKMHKSPPKLALPEFYIQLVVAHVVFGLGTVLGFGLLIR